MNYQYINGADSVAEGFRKANENFQNVPDKASMLSEANSYADTKKTEAVNEAVTEANSYSDTKKNEAVQVSMALAAATFSNPNLLINGDFQVWQRGESFTASGYTADRWYAYMSGSGNIVSHENDGITIDTTSGNVIQLQQFFEEAEFKKLKGKTVTLSINIEIMQGSVAVYSNVDTLKQIGSISASGIHKFTFTVAEDISSFKILFSFLAGRKAVIKWVKLELGEVATPFVPRPYGEELTLCQRYYQKLNRGGSLYYTVGSDVGRGSTTCYVQKTLSTIMRSIPTVTVNGSWRATTGSSHVVVNSIASDASTNTDILSIRCTLASTISNGSIFILQGSNDKNANIELDAEIY